MTANPLLLYLMKRDDLSADDVALVEKLCVPRRQFEIRSDIVKEHSTPSWSTVLMSGFAARYTILEDGRRQISAIHVAGDFVDLHSFLLRHMDHGVLALTDCETAIVPHATLKEISVERPHLTRMLWLSTVIDAAIHRRWIVTSGRLPAEGQMAHFICEIYRRLSVVDGVTDYSFRLPISQIALSDALGLSAVHLNRTLMDLRRGGLIEWRGADVTILDWDRLAALGQFDDTYLSLEKWAR
jgi:CRP-like cAMP-binding protein